MMWLKACPRRRSDLLRQSDVRSDGGQRGLI